MLSKESSPHISVMLTEFLSFFKGRDIKLFFEGTVGAGGHAKALLETHPEIKKYMGCDQDQEALLIAKKVLAPWKEKLFLHVSNFSDLDAILRKEGISYVDGFFLT